jgi:hypothetical protein
MNTNNDMMYEYLMQMGAMRPEEEQMLRRQAQVDALRQGAMEPMRGQMAGRVYVAPGIGEAIAKMGTAYMAGQQQKGVDTAYSNPNYNPDMSSGPSNMPGLNQRRAEELRKMRERMMQRRNPAAATPAFNYPVRENETDSGGTPY